MACSFRRRTSRNAAWRKKAGRTTQYIFNIFTHLPTHCVAGAWLADHSLRQRRATGKAWQILVEAGSLPVQFKRASGLPMDSRKAVNLVSYDGSFAESCKGLHRKAAMDSPLLLDFAAFSNGEWAGWRCEFSAADGKHLPVSENFVPPEMLDWGAGPLGMEILVSELVGTTHKRRQLQVVPEIG